MPSLIHAQSASVEAPISTVPQDFQHQISQSTNALESIPGASGSNINLGWDSAMDSSISPEQSGLFWSPKEFSSSNMQDFDLQKFLDDLMFTGDPPQQQQPQPTTQLDLGRKTLSVENISNSAGPPAGVDNQLLSLWGINEGLSTALYSKTVHFTAPEPHGSFFGDLLEGVSMRHASPFHQPHPDYQQRPFKAVVSHPPSPASTSRQPYIAQSHCTNSSTLADAQLAQRGQQLPYNAPFASLPAARVEIQSTVSADASATTAECTTHHGTLEAAENRERENNVGALLADTWQADIRDASPCPTPSVPESSHPPLTTKEVARELVCGVSSF